MQKTQVLADASGHDQEKLSLLTKNVHNFYSRQIATSSVFQDLWYIFVTVAWVALLALNVFVVDSNSITGPCCFLGQETLPLLLSTGWFQDDSSVNSQSN